MKNLGTRLSLLASLFVAQLASAQTGVVASDLADSYYFVDRYEILIDKPAADVWPNLLDLRSWMYEFAMIHESGPRKAEGEVLRLYEGENFFLEIAKIIPGQLILILHHPSTTRGEESVGIGMLTLTEIEGKTLVSVFASRQYSWFQEPPNPLRETRESAEFQENARITMEDRFLARLRDLADGINEGD